jgi:hypothetical protein
LRDRLAAVVQRAGIQRLQALALALHQGAEVLALPRLAFARRGPCRPGGQPALAAHALHRGGKALVEGGVVGRIGHLVRQFVEDQPRQVALGPADEGVEQRVATQPVAPAQRL